MTESTDKPLPDDEQQLDEYLKGDSSVSRQYRQLHSAEVPAELDRLVLRQAEDAVKDRPGERSTGVDAMDCAARVGCVGGAGGVDRDRDGRAG